MVSYHENSKLYLYSTRFKARSGKKKTTPGKDEWSVVGYSAANSFDMFGLQEGRYCQVYSGGVEPLLDQN